MFRRILIACAGFLLVPGNMTKVFAADVFERHGAQLIKKIAEQGEATKSLTMTEAAKLKPLSPTIGSTCLVVRTDDGGFSKLLVSWGLKKGKRADGKIVPVLLIERFVTYRGDRLDLTSATGKDVMLFPGTGFDLDIGQVVPEGHGADLLFNEEKELQSADAAKMIAISGSQLPPAENSTRRDPNDHEGVLAEDFSGSWKLNADGRWLGELQLKVTDGGKATGTFISDESKNSYDVTGQVGGTPHNLKLEVFLANTQLSVDGYLWTKDKSQMAGTVTMTGRKFGFVATRSPAE